MAILSVSKHWDSHQGSLDQNLGKSIRETWLVVTDSPIDDPQVIINATDPITGESIPVMYAIWTGDVSGQVDTAIRVRDIRPRQTDDIVTWKVEVEYSNETFYDTEQAIGGELARPVVYDWDATSYKRVVYSDRNGLSLSNSAEQLFDPPPEEDAIECILRYQDTIRDSLLNPVDEQTKYVDKVNSDKFLGFDVYTVKCTAYKCRWEKTGGETYWSRSIEFHIRAEDGWYWRPADVGFNRLVTNGDGTKEPRVIQDKFGNSFAHAPFLDGKGQPLSEATTTLSADYDAGAANLQVADGTKVDRTDLIASRGIQTFVTIGTEVLEVTTVAGNLLTVKRGQKGTTAAAHSSGARVFLYPIFWKFETIDKVAMNAIGLGQPGQ